MKKPTIYDIKALTEAKSPYYFVRDTMKHFGQTMKDFTVEVSPKGNIYIHAPMYSNDRNGDRRFMGYSFRQFIGNDLKCVDCKDDTMAQILFYIHNN